MKVAYIDIETNYVGKHTDQALFSDCKNHLITVLGVRVIDAKTDEFIQLVGQDVTKEALIVTSPSFCTSCNERVYITASGCEIGFGGAQGLQAAGAGGL
jgi:hypothetical protein